MAYKQQISMCFKGACQASSIFWWWHVKYYLHGQLGRILRGLFAGSPVGALCAQLLFLLLVGLPTDTSGKLLPWTEPLFLALAALGFLLGTSAIGLYMHGRSLSLHRLHGIRELNSMLDEFAFSIKKKMIEEEIAERLDRFIGEALSIFDCALFPSKSVEMTFMRAGENRRLRIVAVYPLSKEYKRNFYLDIDGELGYARLAYAEGRTVYVPSVNRDWGVLMTLARRPGSLPRRKGSRKNLWKESTRKDFGSLICAPAMVVTDYRDFRFNCYGVLNLEHIRRFPTNSFKAQDLYCGCLAAGILGRAIEASTAQLNVLQQAARG